MITGFKKRSDVSSYPSMTNESVLKRYDCLATIQKDSYLDCPPLVNHRTHTQKNQANVTFAFLEK
ncbi:hypothetical protein EFP55_00635 [Lacticaseibacillus paracasei]|nr:hypothetical protein [Lacticaseibacillus paracasei]